ncbi:MAG: hypothetical protein N3D85_02610 [Candidatus Bathyarchaeota archaeon]|nr:hypothetical protein [Candidatus Bathyarchaeota archaeon]
MIKLSGSVKIWAFASLCSLLVWVIYMFPSNFQHLFNVLSGKQDFYAGNLGVLLSRLAGLWARFGSVVLALTAGFLVCAGGAVKPNSGLAERIVEVALFLEGTYYVLLFPSGLWWLGLGLNFLGVAFLLQAILAGVPLILLSFKIRIENKVKVLKWVGVAAVGYVAALWVNVIFRWFDMIEVIGDTFLFKGVTSWGFLGSMITLSVAVVFAVAGAYLLTENKGESIKWFGFSLLTIGAHYVIYLTYSLSSGNLDLALTIDVWTLPFLGLGAALLRAKTEKAIL